MVKAVVTARMEPELHCVLGMVSKGKGSESMNCVVVDAIREAVKRRVAAKVETLGAERRREAVDLLLAACAAGVALPAHEESLGFDGQAALAGSAGG